MARINVRQSKSREELADEWKDVIGNVFALGSANKEGWLLETNLIGVLVWEISKVIEGSAKDI